MATNKTTQNNNSVSAYLDAIPTEKKRKDCAAIIDLITQVTGLQPKMWGTGIVGFGSYHYKYDSGHQGDAPLTGIAARANAIVLYLSGNFYNREELLQKLGKHKTGKGCVYVQKLEDINTDVLATMVKNSVAHVKEMYP